jgi:alanyl-tRNA synthetase
VTDTQRVAERLIVHRGSVSEGTITVGDGVTATVDFEQRANTAATTLRHLLHAASGGLGTRPPGRLLVGPDHLRFDFTH